MDKINGLITGSVPVMIEFFATWCPHCQRMHPRLDEVENHFGKRLKLVRFDIDSPDNRAAVEHFNVVSVPTMLLFVGGKQVWRESGERTVEELESIIEGHIK